MHRSPTVPNVPVGGPTSVGCVTARRGGPGRSVNVTREGPRRRPVAQWQGRVTCIILLHAYMYLHLLSYNIQIHAYINEPKQDYIAFMNIY